jgi:hypothetical protein
MKIVQSLFLFLVVIIIKVALSAKIVNFCYPWKLSDMIDALIKRVSVTYICYEMYAHRGKKVQLLVCWDWSRNGRHFFFFFFFHNRNKKFFGSLNIIARKKYIVSNITFTLYCTHWQLTVLVLFLQIKVWSFSVLSIRKDSGSLLSS